MIRHVYTTCFCLSVSAMLLHGCSDDPENAAGIEAVDWSGVKTTVILTNTPDGWAHYVLTDDMSSKFIRHLRDETETVPRGAHGVQTHKATMLILALDEEGLPVCDIAVAYQVVDGLGGKNDPSLGLLDAQTERFRRVLETVEKTGTPISADEFDTHRNAFGQAKVIWLSWKN